jgi:hypothetical protein
MKQDEPPDERLPPGRRVGMSDQENRETAEDSEGQMKRHLEDDDAEGQRKRPPGLDQDDAEGQRKHILDDDDTEGMRKRTPGLDDDDDSLRQI